ncbi:MAG: asparagine synthase-related protein, partial [Acidobacteriota bacterium]
NPEGDLIFLSGGKDSRLILATALDATDDPSKVRTISWTSNDPPPGTDVAIARRFAERYGFDHREARRTLAGYGPKSLRLTWVLDGLTDIGAYHGDELRIMEDLQREGFKKVLRGDQCFTRGRAMLDSAYAILRMCIRSTSGLADGAFAWREGPYREVCDAGDAMIESLVAEYRDVQEDNTGDEVYFRHRLQGYLNAAAYFKTLVLDHRNPLLDEGLLRLIQRLSVAARDEQRILDEAGAESFPPYYTEFPFASSSNLERFADQLAQPTPVRAAVRRELDDKDSAAWEWLDREALVHRLDALAAGPGRKRPSFGKRIARAAKKTLRGTVKEVVSKAVYDIPAVDTRIRSVYLKRITRDDEVLFRAVTLKQMIDLFHTGDGSRRVFEQRLDAAREAERTSESRRA